ncbi:TatD family hydrolase [Lachnoclostridium sp. An181]|uniref:TatD family hydrolase n=1 Tax=Lachnoclostridium sp. An181 TaxID=1965575 RepID=UPI000B38555D|nr:TatD family hydrolase [Lachnoclostridium sp. An181]OUP49223.1 hydrolase TatD [Lachnoclostridium sp. An181]
MIFDSHAHYDDEQFDADREQLLSHMKKEGVGTIINVGASLEGCKRSVELTEQYPFIFAAVGVHPDETGELNEETFAWVEQLLDNGKVVAVGEIGLDYHWDIQPREVQKKWFIRQLELARKHNLPVCIHSRDAADDTLHVMKEHAQGLSGVIHCFSYSPEFAREYVKMGFYIGVGGVVTFKNGKKLKQVVKETPLERLLLETDCPYLAPEPYRGKRNCSIYLHQVAQEIARLKDVDVRTVVDVTRENARKLFGINAKENLKEKI